MKKFEVYFFKLLKISGNRSIHSKLFDARERDAATNNLIMMEYIEGVPAKVVRVAKAPGPGPAVR